MRLTLFLFLSFVALTTFGQGVTNQQVEPKGVYKEIDLSNDIRVAQLLLDTGNNYSRLALIDTLEKNANKYTPPVLYVLSNVLFSQKKYSDACFWFYVAQLRARYDVNRCKDKTATASNYNMNFGPDINQYAFHHLDTLKMIIKKVVNFVSTNEELYDQRWIDLTGMDAMTASFSDKPVNKKLSIDKSKWPVIKKKTIDDYYKDFQEATNRDITTDKSTLLGGDYRLFQNTPAWELTKAVQDGDTSMIKDIVGKNKSLLSFREPRFGQPILTLAIYNKNYNSAKALVEKGADPNMQDTNEGKSPLMEAADIGINGVDTDSRFLRLLLKYGGNPNAIEKNQIEHQDKFTLLWIACDKGNFEYVKLLVEAGADVNRLTEYGGSSLYAASISTELTNNPDMVIYLIEKGADYKRPFLTRVNGEKYYITNSMREWHFDLGSEEYKKKMKLVDFLMKNGMDYRKTPIPEGYEKDYSKEYLEKY